MQETQARQVEKKPYIKPELKLHGSVAEMTQHMKLPPFHSEHGRPDQEGHGSHLW